MNDHMIWVQLADIAATADLGAKIADAIKPGDVIALSGGLGAGKTTLARAILAGLGYAGEVTSPSFTIIETYDPPALRLPVVHADFYRLKHPDELNELGLEDYRQGAVLIAEWPEMARGFDHEAGCLSITLESADDARRAIVSPGADWQERFQTKWNTK